MRPSVIGICAEDKFHALLFEIDVAAAGAVRAGRCPRPGCGGRLDVANYPRKVRGIAAAGEVCGRYELRLSLCCAVEGCRRRSTPPSVRFLGRLVYAMRVAVAWAASRAAAPAPTPSPARQTMKRWAGYWNERVPQDASMAVIVAALVVSSQAAPNLAAALMGAASGTEAERTVITHRQLAPLTTATVPPERSRLAMLS